jgi:hypothetical protein
MKFYRLHIYGSIGKIHIRHRGVCVKHRGVCVKHRGVCVKHRGVCVKHRGVCVKHREHMNTSEEAKNLLSSLKTGGLITMNTQRRNILLSSMSLCGSKAKKCLQLVMVGGLFLLSGQGISHAASADASVYWVRTGPPRGRMNTVSASFTASWNPQETSANADYTVGWHRGAPYNYSVSFGSGSLSAPGTLSWPGNSSGANDLPRTVGYYQADLVIWHTEYSGQVIDAQDTDTSPCS